jgi:hypothetical protein
MTNMRFKLKVYMLDYAAITGAGGKKAQAREYTPLVPMTGVARLFSPLAARVRRRSNDLGVAGIA